MKRKNTLEQIRVECAKEGRITQCAIRLYIENRVSYQAFMEASKQGMALYNGKKIAR